MQGQKHLIKCRCILSQFKSKKDPPFHHFVVFSEINDDGSVKPKYSQCNNCGIIHKIIDICKSEILEKKENSNSIITIDDIKSSIHQNLSIILEKNNADLATWESCQFCLNNKLWGSKITITSEIENETRTGKVLTIIGESLFKIDSYSREEFIKNEWTLW